MAQWELVELSAVPVPANPEALTRELQKGAIQVPALRKALGEMLGGAEPTKEDAVGMNAPEGDGSTARPGADAKPEISQDALVGALLPSLWKGLREWAERAAVAEIRRRQGRLD